MKVVAKTLTYHRCSEESYTLHFTEKTNPPTHCGLNCEITAEPALLTSACSPVACRFNIVTLILLHYIY